MIDIPKGTEVKNMRKSNNKPFKRVRSPTKPLTSTSSVSGVSESSSPTKYNRLQTLLSQIEEY